MKQIVIDRTFISVSRLAFGTGSLHHLFLRTARCRLLNHAAEAGITHFDTSPYYGNGLAEAAIGDLLHGRRDKFTVATKVGLYATAPSSRNVATVWFNKAIGRVIPAYGLPREDWSIERASKSLEASLRRLRTDYVDFLFAHEPRLTPVGADALYDWLDKQLRRGTVRAFGVAGIEDRIRPLLQEGHPIANVIQTCDSLERHEANFVLRAGRSLQFTYGYLSRLISRYDSPIDIVRNAVLRNQTGALIISSRRPHRVAALAKEIS